MDAIQLTDTFDYYNKLRVEIDSLIDETRMKQSLARTLIEYMRNCLPILRAQYSTLSNPFQVMDDLRNGSPAAQTYLTQYLRTWFGDRPSISNISMIHSDCAFIISANVGSYLVSLSVPMYNEKMDEVVADNFYYIVDFFHHGSHSQTYKNISPIIIIDELKKENY